VFRAAITSKTRASRNFHAREIDFHFDRTIKVNTDGEVLEADSCRYRILPRAARFLAGDAPYAAQ